MVNAAMSKTSVRSGAVELRMKRAKSIEAIPFGPNQAMNSFSGRVRFTPVNASSTDAGRATNSANPMNPASAATLPVHSVATTSAPKTANATICSTLLLGASAVSGLTRRTVLSTAVLAVAAGILLALTGVVELSPRDEGLVVLVELVLLLTLFSDGLLVEEGLLRRHWHPAARALVLAMPVNAVLLALLAKLLFGQLSWLECFLLGFALSPTDPVVTSSVVASARVPDENLSTEHRRSSSLPRSSRTPASTTRPHRASPQPGAR